MSIHVHGHLLCTIVRVAQTHKELDKTSVVIWLLMALFGEVKRTSNRQMLGAHEHDRKFLTKG